MSPSAVAFLCVSSTSVVIQLVSFWRLRRRRMPHVEHQRVLRTIVSRALAAAAYLAFGIAALVSPVWSLRLGLPLFTMVQGLWWANSLADTRRLPPANTGSP